MKSHINRAEVTGPVVRTGKHEKFASGTLLGQTTEVTLAVLCYPKKLSKKAYLIKNNMTASHIPYKYFPIQSTHVNYWPGRLFSFLSSSNSV